MLEANAYTLVLIKADIAKERELVEKLIEFRSIGDATSCSFCKYPNSKRCDGLKLIALGWTTGRFDVCAVIQSPRIDKIHDFVLDCIRGALKDAVLDTESMFFYEIAGGKEWPE